MYNINSITYIYRIKSNWISDLIFWKPHNYQCIFKIVINLWYLWSFQLHCVLRFLFIIDDHIQLWLPCIYIINIKPIFILIHLFWLLIFSYLRNLQILILIILISDVFNYQSLFLVMLIFADYLWFRIKCERALDLCLIRHLSWWVGLIIQKFTGII